MPSTDDRRQDVARRLDEARVRGHLSIRAAAKVAGVPTATVQGWLNGRHSPTPALRPNFARLVAALGLTDELDLDWVGPDSLGGLRAATPYVGLRPYRPADAPLYSGRRAETRRLAEVVRAREGRGIVAVVGSSGSGKSSLLGAGLIGHECGAGGVLERCRGALVPLDALADVPDSVTVAVVDQFEDVLTLPGGPDDAVARVAGLSGRGVVVLGIRADAWGDLLGHPALTDALTHPFVIAGMTEADLREVIERPAQDAGVTVDPGFADVILSDLAPPGSGRTLPVSVLPLLSNALLATWGVGRGRRMTVADYRATGGLATAVESLAEEVYAGLTPAAQDAARGLFLHLVSISDDAVVRDQRRLGDLDPATQAVAVAFADARILTISDDSVHIGHDALLTHWPRLADWVADGRDDLRLRRVAVTLAALAAVLAVVAGSSLVDARRIQAAAQSRQVASEARTIRSRDTNVGAQMALVSEAVAPTRESLSALLNATSLDAPARWPGRGRRSWRRPPTARSSPAARGMAS